MLGGEDWPSGNSSTQAEDEVWDRLAGLLKGHSTLQPHLPQRLKDSRIASLEAKEWLLSDRETEAEGWGFTKAVFPTANNSWKHWRWNTKTKGSNRAENNLSAQRGVLSFREFEFNYPCAIGSEDQASFFSMLDLETQEIIELWFVFCHHDKRHHQNVPYGRKGLFHITAPVYHRRKSG